MAFPKSTSFPYHRSPSSLALLVCAVFSFVLLNLNPCHLLTETTADSGVGRFDSTAGLSRSSPELPCSPLRHAEHGCVLHVGQNAVHISADGTDAATALKKLLQQHSTSSKALANLFVANIDTTKVTSKLHVFPAWIPSLALAQVIRSTVIIV